MHLFIFITEVWSGLCKLTTYQLLNALMSFGPTQHRPTLVQTTSSSLHILDVPPYNQFTVSCSARAELEGETLPLYIILMNWIVRKETPSSFVSFIPVPSTRYRTTGSHEDGYLSILNTTETDTVNTISYRCKATLLISRKLL